MGLADVPWEKALSAAVAGNIPAWGSATSMTAVGMGIGKLISIGGIQ